MLSLLCCFYMYIVKCCYIYGQKWKLLLQTFPVKVQ